MVVNRTAPCLDVAYHDQPSRVRVPHAYRAVVAARDKLVLVRVRGKAGDRAVRVTLLDKTVAVRRRVHLVNLTRSRSNEQHAPEQVKALQAASHRERMRDVTLLHALRKVVAPELHATLLATRHDHLACRGATVRHAVDPLDVRHELVRAEQVDGAILRSHDRGVRTGEAAAQHRLNVAAR